MPEKKTASNQYRAERRMDRTGAGRNLLASMSACRSALGIYIAQNRGGKKQSDFTRPAGVGAAALTNLEIGKGKVSRADVLALIGTMDIPEGKSLAQLYNRLTLLIEAFGGSFE